MHSYVSFEEPDILLQEVQAAIKEARNKSSGIDLITSEILKTLNDEGVKVVHKICHFIWKMGKWPKEWTTSIEHIVYLIRSIYESDTAVVRVDRYLSSECKVRKGVR